MILDDPAGGAFFVQAILGLALVTYLGLNSIRLWPFGLTLDVGPLRAVLPGSATLVAAAAFGLILYRGRDRA